MRGGLIAIKDRDDTIKLKLTLIVVADKQQVTCEFNIMDESLMSQSASTPLDGHFTTLIEKAIEAYDVFEINFRQLLSPNDRTLSYIERSL